MGSAQLATVPVQRDRPPRTITREHCVIARQNGSIVTGILVNLSERGFCLESATPFDATEQIELRVLGTRLQASVKWAKDHRAGGLLQHVKV